MEAVFGIEGNNEGKKGESKDEKSGSALSSPNHLADPVVYKLVRVEGDGRFVPATDDEIMEVEGFLQDDKIKTYANVETEQSVGQMDNENSSNVKSPIESPKGLLQFQSLKADQGKLDARIKDIADSTSQSLNEGNLLQHGSLEKCFEHEQRSVESGSSASPVCISSKLEFSLSSGEICLDNLSIRELHELFKESFGRETTVKDKPWLKRRIAMGLTNSIDVPATSFVIKDGKFVEQGERESHQDVIEKLATEQGEGESHQDIVGRPATDHDIQALDIECTGLPTNHKNSCEVDEDLEAVSKKRLRSCSIDSRTEGHMDERAAKRIRKPTRRYIEELSEVDLSDFSQRSMTSSQTTGVGKTSPNLFVRPINNGSSNRKTFATRLDSLGGSSVHIPCVFRIRRSRPRKNVRALMKFNVSGFDIATKLVEKALVLHKPQQNSDCDVVPLQTRSPSEEIQLSFIGEAEKDQLSAMGTVESGMKKQGLKEAASSGSSLDDSVIIVPTAKGGMRRKHHRAWSLVEVMKLVEGVSKCGPGRWSEIKRLAFSSYSYRTSVDLKDKWRNLLKASFAQAPPDEGINSRKNAAVPIPVPILLRVRELAERRNAQAPLHLGSTKGGAKHGGRNSHDITDAYL